MMLYHPALDRWHSFPDKTVGIWKRSGWQEVPTLADEPLDPVAAPPTFADQPVDATTPDEGDITLTPSQED